MNWPSSRSRARRRVIKQCGNHRTGGQPEARNSHCRGNSGIRALPVAPVPFEFACAAFWLYCAASGGAGCGDCRRRGRIMAVRVFHASVRADDATRGFLDANAALGVSLLIKIICLSCRSPEQRGPWPRRLHQSSALRLTCVFSFQSHSRGRQQAATRLERPRQHLPAGYYTPAARPPTRTRGSPSRPPNLACPTLERQLSLFPAQHLVGR